jgi:hypothetical protein
MKIGIVTRKQAMENGDKYYFTGKSCKHGHISSRWTYNSVCVGCEELVKLSNYHKGWYTKNKNLLSKKQRNRRQENPEKFLEIQAKYRNNNRQKIREGNAKRKKQNPNREAFYAAKRRARKLKATPKWANLSYIKEIYLTCPKGFHVDHIIPLQGKNVCGLHIENNLQYLTVLENTRKGNRYESF